MEQQFIKIAILIMHLYICSEVCHCISVTEVVAPPVIKVGGTGDLECRWQLQDDEQLYSVKWYHGFDEIYRYTPSKRDKVKVFSNNYLVVDSGHSSKGRVRVRNISLDAEGLFRCEVSAEAPSFYTDYGTINITVVALPIGGPHIIGVRRQYQIKEWADLSCVSPESKPPSRLSILINGRKPPPSWLDSPRVRAGLLGKSSSSQRMQFVVMPDLVASGAKIKVQCDAEIQGLYKSTSQVQLSVTGPFLAPVKGGPLDSGVNNISFDCGKRDLLAFCFINAFAMRKFWFIFML